MVTAIDHVGVIVQSIDRALPYYLDQLGLSVADREELPEAGVRIAFLAVGSTRLQLVEPTAPGPLQDHLDVAGEGLHHVCFAVDDIDQALSHLAAGEAVRVVRGGGGRRACFLPARPGGLRIELTEIVPAQTIG